MMQYGIKSVTTENFEEWYKRELMDLLDQPTRMTRNGATRAKFGATITIKPEAPMMVPLLQGRRMYPKGIAGELQTFLEGPRDVQHFKDNGCNYWDFFGDEKGNLKVDYGNLWRDFEGVNQMVELIKGLKSDPAGRRHLISGWHPGRLKDLSLPCCHYMYQWFVNIHTGELEMMWLQRSADMVLGVPSDIALGFLLNSIVANTVERKIGPITFVFGDTHIYTSHEQGVREYLGREDESIEYFSYVKPSATVHNFRADDWVLEGYQPQDKIPFQIC